MSALSRVKNVKKQTSVLLVAIAAMVAVTFALAAPAQANADTVSTPLTYESIVAGGSDVDAQQDCDVTFAESMTQRSEPYTNAPALGVVPADASIQAVCDGVRAGEYTACGITSNIWILVYWNSDWGYVAASCLSS